MFKKKRSTPLWDYFYMITAFSCFPSLLSPTGNLKKNLILLWMYRDHPGKILIVCSLELLKYKDFKIIIPIKELQ